MIKLKELNLSTEDISKLQINLPKESGISLNYLNKTTKYDTYKGYRFYEIIKGNIIYVILTTVEPISIIGFVKLKKDVEKNLKIFNNSNIAHYSIEKILINDEQNCNKLKTILYDYILKKYTIIMDNTPNNKKIWMDYLPIYTDNTLFTISNPQNINKNFLNIDLLDNISNTDNLCFLGISNKNIIFDKIFSAINHNFKNYEDGKNIIWTYSDIGKTEILKSIKNNTFKVSAKNNILDLLKNQAEIKAIIIVGKNYCTLVRLDNNLKIKVLDF